MQDGRFYWLLHSEEKVIGSIFKRLIQTFNEKRTKERRYSENTGFDGTCLHADVHTLQSKLNYHNPDVEVIFGSHAAY